MLSVATQKDPVSSSLSEGDLGTQSIEGSESFLYRCFFFSYKPPHSRPKLCLPTSLGDQLKGSVWTRNSYVRGLSLESFPLCVYVCVGGDLSELDPLPDANLQARWPPCPAASFSQSPDPTPQAHSQALGVAVNCLLSLLVLAFPPGLFKERNA